MLKPGKYPIHSFNHGIQFRVGRRDYGIFKTQLMQRGIAMECLHEIRANGRIHPLKNITGNRFKLGKYGEWELVVNFNFIEIHPPRL